MAHRTKVCLLTATTGCTKEQGEFDIYKHFKMKTRKNINRWMSIRSSQRRTSELDDLCSRYLMKPGGNVMQIVRHIHPIPDRSRHPDLQRADTERCSSFQPATIRAEECGRSPVGSHVLTSIRSPQISLIPIQSVI